ncbi:MAG: YHS domain-containing (seleno)protein [Cyclobacteriaceae bacterium]
MILKIVGVVLVLLIIGMIVIAKTKGVSPLSWKMHKKISQKNELAIGGFDPVAFFEQKQAIKGNADYSYEWQDANWNFATAEGLERFKANPEKFQPEFGGYCAFAVSKGFTATSDPTSWYVHNDKLFLFADVKVKDKWVSQLPDILETGTKKWQY